MFRKLVSSLPFSPALVGQLGFYARRLSKEQATRRLGLIFTGLAICVQAFALISPPEQTYAASPTNECRYNSALTADETDCQACPYNPSIWYKNMSCSAQVELSIDATNLSKSGKAATSVSADPGDRIQYNVHTKNVGSSKINATIEQQVKDILEYGTVIDAGGGTFDQAARTVSWGNVELPAEQVDTRSFVVQLNDSFAATPQAADDPSSYDCTLATTYGNSLNIHLNCPIGKDIEGTIKQLPETGIGMNAFFSAAVVAVVTYLYARTRQMNREMRIIRREFNVG